MEDPELLKQQLEFLQLELDDARAKEIQSKCMYESMIKSLTVESSLHTVSLEEMNKLKSDYSTQITSLKKRYKEKSSNLKNTIEKYKEQNLELECNLREIKIKHEDKITKISQDIYTFNERGKETDCSFVSDSADKKTIDRLRVEIDNLHKEIDTIKEESEQELIRTRDQSNRNIQDFKEIYEQDKKFLECTIKKLQQELSEEKESNESKSINYDYIPLDQQLESSIDFTSEKLEDVEQTKNEISRAIEEWKSELENLVINVREKLLESSSFSLKKQIDKSEQMLSFAEDTQDEIRKLKNQLLFFQKLMKTFENNENKLKEHINIQDEEIDKLKRAIRIRISDDRSSDYQTNDQLLSKETEIIRLKRLVGELRCEISLNVSKPPIPSSPKGKHNRAQTMVAKNEFSPPKLLKENNYDNIPHDFIEKIQEIINNAHSIECKLCRSSVNPHSFPDHIQVCKQDKSIKSDHVDIQHELKIALSKIKELENEKSVLLVNFGKMKNYKDKANIEYEKLIFGYKDAKLKLAL